MEDPNWNSIAIRSIQPDDNVAIARIVRESLSEFGANHLGTVYYDETTDHLFELFREPLAYYFIAEKEGVVLGGAGIFPSKGLPEGTCELVKMYLVPEIRGQGLGGRLIALCLAKAKENGFSKVYIETMPELRRAMSIYEKFGFRYLEGPLGNTGHFGCAIWMLKDPI
jgi:putative acetyltransferase